jgi:hypothetical protein
MNTLRNLLTLVVAMATVHFASAAVPSAINYQGRLTNAAGVPHPGTRAMNVKIHDSATPAPCSMRKPSAMLSLM